MFILNKIINFNRLGFYVALTLFWSLFLHHFKKDTHHYYKMYDVNKFFKLLQLYERDDKNNKDLDLNSIFQLLLLISIYQNYVILSKEEAASCHDVFQDFFKVSPHDCEKLKTYLSKIRALMEVHFPVTSNQNADALMVSTRHSHCNGYVGNLPTWMNKKKVKINRGWKKNVELTSKRKKEWHANEAE